MVVRSTYRGLIQEKIIEHDDIKARDELDEEVKVKFCVVLSQILRR